MKKINALITKMCFIALCALPIIISSCNDDDDKYYYPTNFENLSLPNDTIIAKGEDLTLKPTLNLINPKIYSWKIDGKEVSTRLTTLSALRLEENTRSFSKHKTLKGTRIKPK